MSAEERFATVVQAMAGDGVTPAKMFGAPGLKVGGKFFASLYKGQFVVKLPRARVDHLLAAAGHGQHFDPGMGRQMKEWIALPPNTPLDWVALAAEARDFVSGSSTMTRGEVPHPLAIESDFLPPACSRTP